MPIDTNFRPGKHLCASFQKEGQIAVDTCQVGYGIQKKTSTVTSHSGISKPGWIFFNFGQSGISSPFYGATGKRNIR